MTPDPLAALLPDASLVVSRLAVVAREHRFLRRLLTLIVQGRDELAYREANASPTSPAIDGALACMAQAVAKAKGGAS